jgi:hypothetical protein
MKKGEIMKKLVLMTFALALISGFITQINAGYREDGRYRRSYYRSDEPARRAVMGGLLGAGIGGAVGGGRGAAIGAGVGAFSGAATTPYYEEYDPYYDDGGAYEEPYYEPAGFGIPVFMDINGDVECANEDLIALSDYPVNRNYVPGLPREYEEYWQKEGFYPRKEYEVNVGPYISTRMDTNGTIVEQDFPRSNSMEKRSMRYEAEPTFYEPVEPIVAPIAETTRAIAEPVAETVADVTEPVAEFTYDVLEPVAQTTSAVVAPIAETAYDVTEPVYETTEDVVEPVARTTRNVIRPVSETAADIVAAPLSVLP